MIDIDIRHGSGHDLLRPGLQRLIRGLVRSGVVVAVWMGTPCSSWSIARAGGNVEPLRSSLWVLGLPNLSAKGQLAVDTANAMASFSAALLRLCGSLGVPAVFGESAHVADVVGTVLAAGHLQPGGQVLCDRLLWLAVLLAEANACSGSLV